MDKESSCTPNPERVELELGSNIYIPLIKYFPEGEKCY